MIAKILISLVVSVATLVAGLNVDPSIFSIKKFTPHFGNVGVTTITTATNLANFPAIYNTDLPALDNGKIDVGTTSLPTITTLAGLTSAASLATVGTITSGTWRGTILEGSYGGTGTSTAATNQVMLGNGASGLTTVSGFGVSGQSLVSNGASVAPTWQSISFDQTLPYTLTGLWTFNTKGFVSNATTTIAASSTSINPFVLRGLPYAFPTQRGASSTVLMEDGTGKLSWNPSPYATLSQAGNLALSTSNTSTTTVLTTAIPAGTISASSALTVTVMGIGTGVSGSCWYQIDYGSGTATTTLIYVNNGTSVNLQNARAFLTATSSSSVYGYGEAQHLDVPPTVDTSFGSYFFANVNTLATSYIDFRARNTSGAGTCTIIDTTIQVISQ